MSPVLPGAGNRRTPLLVGLLVLGLLLAQALLLSHQIDHALHPQQGVCVTCLGLAGTHAAVPAATVSFTPPTAGRGGIPARVGEGSFPAPRGYHSRAPPGPASRSA